MGRMGGEGWRTSCWVAYRRPWQHTHAALWKWFADEYVDAMCAKSRWLGEMAHPSEEGGHLRWTQNNLKLWRADLTAWFVLQCGTDAQWRYTDAGQTRVEVFCPDCGSFELAQAEFDEAETDIAG